MCPGYFKLCASLNVCDSKYTHRKNAYKSLKCCRVPETSKTGFYRVHVCETRHCFRSNLHVLIRQGSPMKRWCRSPRDTGIAWSRTPRSSRRYSLQLLDGLVEYGGFHAEQFVNEVNDFQFTIDLSLSLSVSLSAHAHPSPWQPHGLGWRRWDGGRRWRMRWRRLHGWRRELHGWDGGRVRNWSGSREGAGSEPEDEVCVWPVLERRTGQRARQEPQVLHGQSSAQVSPASCEHVT